MRKQDLINAIIKGEQFTYQGFISGVFSNWYPVKFQIEDKTFYSSEQAFMYLKAQIFEDDYHAEKILRTISPQEAKILGRKVRNFDEDKWKSLREDVMYQAVHAKFTQNDPIRHTLIKTNDDVLVEGNSADYIWGAGVDMMDKRLYEPVEWPGENLLGFVLMDLRENLRGHED
jgi:ribA/ribD-fused uncharacterized protein